jgi:uncharacterized membrane protein YgcG
MKKKLFLLFLIMFIISASLFGLDRVVDTADLLSDTEAASLKGLLDTISTTYDFDMVVVSVKQTDDTEPMDFASGFFDKNGYGLGQSRDGCLLLIVTERQVFWFGTSGRGKKILTPAASKKLEKEVFNFLEKSDFYNAFHTYARDWEKFLSLDAKGRTYNALYTYNVVLVVIAWVVSLGIGFLIVMTWKKRMNTKIPKKQAVSYITPGSLSFAVQKDQFLYSTVTKTEMDSDSDEGDDTDASLPEKGKAAGNSEDEEEDQ